MRNAAGIARDIRCAGEKAASAMATYFIIALQFTTSLVARLFILIGRRLCFDMPT